MRLYYLSILFFLGLTLNAQRILSLNLYPTKTTVVIKFVISAGPSCSGYTVLHSLDSLTYSEIDYEPGICGSTSGPEEKSYTHLSPVFGQVNYYKVRLEPYVETSFSRNIFLSTSGTSVRMLAYPNPVYLEDDLLTLKIFNKENTRFEGYLCNQFGRIIRELDLRSIEDLATLPTSGLESGLYIIWLTDGYEQFQTKFVIYR